MKKVLLISPFIHPEPISTGRYNTHLVQHLARQQCQTRVIASYPIYPDWRPSDTDATLAGVQIQRGGRWVRYPRNPLLRRLVLEVWFAFYVALTTGRHLRHHDVLVPVFPPSLFFFLLTVFLPGKLRVVGIVHDLQGIYARNAKGMVGRLLKKVIAIVEKRAFRRCDRVIFVSRSMAEAAIANYGLEAECVKVTYPFVSIAAPGLLDAGQKKLLSDLFPRTARSRHIVYAGALGDKQNPRELYRFMVQAVKEIDDLHFHIYSSGPYFNDLKAVSEQERQANLHFRPLLPENLLPYVYRLADLNLVPQVLDMADGSMPSKLPNILACHGRILGVGGENSEVRELVEEFQAGIYASTWDPGELTVQVLHELRTMGRSAFSLEPVSFALDSRIIDRFSASTIVSEVLG